MTAPARDDGEQNCPPEPPEPSCTDDAAGHIQSCVQNENKPPLPDAQQSLDESVQSSDESAAPQKPSEQLLNSCPPESQSLLQPEQQPLPQPPAVEKLTSTPSIQVYVDPQSPQPTKPQSVHPCVSALLDHDNKENIPPNIWMQYALHPHPDQKSPKSLKPNKLAVPLSDAGVHKKRDRVRSPLRDITSAVIANRRPSLLMHPRSPRKKHLTLRYLR